MAEHTDNVNEIFLVLRCQSGDRDAFDDLLRSIQTRLWRYIAHLTSDPDLADDILQEVFLIIYRKIGWLNEPKLFRPWVYRIATRETFRVMRKRSKWREDALDEAIIESLREPEVRIELDVERLEKLSPASRAVLMLHYLEELSISETADVLDISVGTVKSRLAYGLKILREQINPHEVK